MHYFDHDNYVYVTFVARVYMFCCQSIYVLFGAIWFICALATLCDLNDMINKAW